MPSNFLWVEASSLPFKVLSFYEPVEELILPLDAIGKVKAFFQALEYLTKKGLYALGFITYEAGYLLEQRLTPLYRAPTLPLAHFLLFKKVKKEILFPQKKSIKFKISSTKFNITKEEYKEAIHKIKDYIAKGDTYQVNYTTKFHFLFQGDPWDLFYVLLFSQRCEYACYLPFPEYTVLSLSPELFLKKRKKKLLSSPMKGTLRRGYTYKEDLLFKRALKEDLKSQAENIMIVDLIRNDLGRVCEKGSVWVKNLFQINTYPTLHQMISSVSGTLENASLFEVFKALFPCGSVTGAPKIRTMEIIRELEKEPRNVYTGSTGFITPKGDFIFNVAIRTALLYPEGKNKYRGELGVGAGIVWDSTPEKEYAETKLKANFFFNPLPYFFLFETFRW
ncbi:MAG: aminodeoxychorismate synthase component I, partial [Caldimicrobium sp.]